MESEEVYPDATPETFVDTVIHPGEPHVATVLLIDTSGSMSGPSIREINEGLKLFKNEVLNDNLARKRVDLAVVTFGGSNEVNVISPFGPIENFDPPILVAHGGTPLGKGILKAIELVEERKREYKSKGIDYYRPWIFMMTDGAPTDMTPGDPMWANVVDNVHTGEKNAKFSFFAVAVEHAAMGILQQIAPPTRHPVKLKEGQFKTMFAWLSKSASSIANSGIGAQTQLPDVGGWVEVQS